MLTAALWEEDEDGGEGQEEPEALRRSHRR